MTNVLKPGSQVIVTIGRKFGGLDSKKLATVDRVHKNGRFTVHTFDGQWRPIGEDKGELCANGWTTCYLSTPERLAEYRAEIADEKIKYRGRVAQNTIAKLSKSDMTPELVEALERACELAGKREVTT